MGTVDTLMPEKMRKLVATMAIVSAVGTYSSGAEAVEVAAPLGVNLEDTESCLNLQRKYPTKMNPHSSRVEARGKTRNDPNSLVVIEPTAAFPNARNISAYCNKGAIVNLIIVGNKTRMLQGDVAIALAGLLEKYRYHAGDKKVADENTDTTFTSGRVVITLRSKATDAYYAVWYEVFDKPPFELTERDMELIRRELESQKQTKSAL